MENNSFPVMPTDKNTEHSSRNVPIYLVAVAGGVIGMVAAYVALWLTPNDVESEHDYAISFFYYLVPTYSTLVGIWIGCLKRTKTNLLAGPLIGFFAGALHSVFIFYIANGISAVVSALISGIAASAIGYFIPGSPSLLQRFTRGTLIGFLSIHLFDLLICSIFGSGTYDFRWSNLDLFIAWHWNSGPWAMGGAGAFYLVFFHWATGLGIHLNFLSPNTRLLPPSQP